MTDPIPAAGTPAPAAAVVDGAAPAAAAAPAAPVAPAVAPAAAVDTSLIPADGAASPPDPAVVEAKKADPNAPAPVVHPEWFLSEGVKGTGEAPAWYRADKYKTVAAQAEAYKGLEKKLGAFTGAPPDGKYEFKLPEGIDGEFDTEHPMYKDLTKAASEMQISNEGFNKLMGMFAQYEASIAPNPATNLAAAKTALGADADARIKSAAFWAKANLTPEQFNDFRAATDAAEMSGEQIARVVRVVEAAISKTRVTMPKVGADVPSQTQDAEAAVRIEHQRKDAKGGLLYFSDAQHRAKVDKMRTELQNSRPAA